MGYAGNAGAPEGYEREGQDHRGHHAATNSQKDWPSGVTSCIMGTMLLVVSTILDRQRWLLAYEVDPDRVTVNRIDRVPSFKWYAVGKLGSGIARMCG